MAVNHVVRDMKGFNILYAVCRINNALHPDDDVFWLVLLASISAPLHGVCNAVVFGMDRQTMSKLTFSQIKVCAIHAFKSGQIMSRMRNHCVPKSHCGLVGADIRIITLKIEDTCFQGGHAVNT